MKFSHLANATLKIDFFAAEDYPAQKTTCIYWTWNNLSHEIFKSTFASGELEKGLFISETFWTVYLLT